MLSSCFGGIGSAAGGGGMTVLMVMKIKVVSLSAPFLLFWFSSL